MSNFSYGSIVQWKRPYFVSYGNSLSHDIAWIDDRRAVLYTGLFYKKTILFSLKFVIKMVKPFSYNANYVN